MFFSRRLSFTLIFGAVILHQEDTTGGNITHPQFRLDQSARCQLISIQSDFESLTCTNLMPSILLYRLPSISSLSATIKKFAIACISNSTTPPPHQRNRSTTIFPNRHDQFQRITQIQAPYSV